MADTIKWVKMPGRASVNELKEWACKWPNEQKVRLTGGVICGGCGADIYHKFEGAKVVGFRCGTCSTGVISWQKEREPKMKQPGNVPPPSPSIFEQITGGIAGALGGQAAQQQGHQADALRYAMERRQQMAQAQMDAARGLSPFRAAAMERYTLEYQGLFNNGAPAPPAPETDLAWLDRRVREVCVVL